jgi:hypothetical protein
MDPANPSTARIKRIGSGKRPVPCVQISVGDSYFFGGDFAPSSASSVFQTREQPDRLEEVEVVSFVKKPARGNSDAGPPATQPRSRVLAALIQTGMVAPRPFATHDPHWALKVAQLPGTTTDPSSHWHRWRGHAGRLDRRRLPRRAYQPRLLADQRRGWSPRHSRRARFTPVARGFN